MFIRDGDDLHFTVRVPMVEAALGTSVSVDAIIDGPTVVKVEPGSQPGSVVTMRGKGMPHLRTGVRGNLHAHLDVVVPTRIDAKERELLKDFKKVRSKETAEVVWAESASGGVFSRLREAFTGR